MTNDFIKGGLLLKVEVDQDLCISCGLCVDECPDVFQWNDAGKVEEQSKEVPKDKQAQVKSALESCPTDAIKEL